MHSIDVTHTFKDWSQLEALQRTDSITRLTLESEVVCASDEKMDCGDRGYDTHARAFLVVRQASLHHYRWADRHRLYEYRYFH